MLVLIIWAAASVLFGIIYFLVSGGRGGSQANIFRAFLACPLYRYRSGRTPDWLKLKNPEAPAVRREAEEDWAK